MKNRSTGILEDHLQLLDNIQEVGTDEFFYTRLKARMEARNAGEEWGFVVRPAMAIAALSLLLILNGFLLFQFSSTEKSQTEGYSIQRFAADYNQSINSIY
ncbi:MAG: hypothetical protein ACK5GP_09980 [bacterium]|jgi:hypothetical protein|nr:hypothetical protein [Chitinophagaceae bacterium]